MNICIHYDLPNGKLIFCHILVVQACDPVHLNLTEYFTPYIRVGAQPAASEQRRITRDPSASSDEDHPHPKSPVFSRKREAKSKLARALADADAGEEVSNQGAQPIIDHVN